MTAASPINLPRRRSGSSGLVPNVQPVPNQAPGFYLSRGSDVGIVATFFSLSNTFIPTQLQKLVLHVLKPGHAKHDHIACEILTERRMQVAQKVRFDSLRRTVFFPILQSC